MHSATYKKRRKMNSLSYTLPSINTGEGKRFSENPAAVCTKVNDTRNPEPG
jgi:hypothetical protein